MRDKSGTLALVIASVVLVASLAGLGKVYWNKRAEDAIATVDDSGSAPEQMASTGSEAAPRAGSESGAPSQRGTGRRSAPTGSRQGFDSGAAPGDTGESGGRGFGGGGFPGPGQGSTPGQGDSMQRGATGGQFPGFGQRGVGGQGGSAGTGQRAPRPGSTGAPGAGRPTASSGGGRGTTASSASTGGAGRTSGGSGGGGQPLGPDPQVIAQWDRDIQRARETLQDAKVAVRENNQDQLQELLDEALAELPNVTSQTAAARGSRMRTSSGEGAAAQGQIPGPPGAASMADTLALGQRVQELLFSTLDTVRGLTPEQYEAQRNQIVIGILTRLLTSGQTSYGGFGGGSGLRMGPGSGQGAGSGAPFAAGRGGRAGRSAPPGQGQMTPIPDQQ